MDGTVVVVVVAILSERRCTHRKQCQSEGDETKQSHSDSRREPRHACFARGMKESVGTDSIVADSHR